jgi:hypothetical protein
MLHFLRDEAAFHRTRWQGWVPVRRWRTSERKLRLVACACCRRVAERMPGREALAVVEAAEAHADGRCSLAEVGRALAAAERAEQERARKLIVPLEHPPDSTRRSLQALSCLADDDLERVVTVVHMALMALRTAAILTTDRGSFEGPAQANLLREIVGNPFQPPRLDPAWLAWNGGIVEHIARGIHEGRSYQDMLILADALADAGCCDEAILGHCRTESATHVPGCWVIDALLSKH